MSGIIDLPIAPALGRNLVQWERSDGTPLRLPSEDIPDPTTLRLVTPGSSQRSG
ncbi:hypothetical protein [Sphingomonas sp. AAP5]|uniref:hypothetical protein n=1 Tax=Sphingomonas sp. AAP5 TaxID=1523415 RepID=UPI0014050751|nr:hypothetical protein [Sphingomonas sp. AAP5]